MIVKRKSLPRSGTRLAASREQRRWPSQSKAFWAEVMKYAAADEQGAVRGRSRKALAKLVRVPCSFDYVECSCGASDKDACACIRDTMRSNMATAASGVALSSKTA